ELERHLSVHGRVVDLDGVTPVTDAEVVVHSIDEDGNSCTRSAHTKPGGAFEGFLSGKTRRVELRFARGRAGEGASQREFAVAPGTIEVDAGDLQLTAGRSFTLRVLDTKGGPVTGALTGASTATDANGAARVTALGEAVHAMWVVAPGFLPRVVDL